VTDDPIVPEGDAATLAFPDCDLLQLVPERPPGGRARCARCARVLATRSSSPIDRPLALSLTALLVLIVANTTSLMGLWVAGRQASTTIVGGAYQMWLQGQEITAVIVAFCALIAPAAYILFLLIVLLAAKRPPAPQWVGEMLRWADAMQPWAMVEVMMLGILVALVKIADLAHVEPDIGMYAVGILVLLFPAIAVSLDPEEIWARLEWADGESPFVVRETSAPEPPSAGSTP
jgi:paraquat-inducible protein A